MHSQLLGSSKLFCGFPNIQTSKYLRLGLADLSLLAFPPHSLFLVSFWLSGAMMPMAAE